MVYTFLEWANLYIRARVTFGDFPFLIYHVLVMYYVTFRMHFISD